MTDSRQEQKDFLGITTQDDINTFFERHEQEPTDNIPSIMAHVEAQRRIVDGGGMGYFSNYDVWAMNWLIGEVLNLRSALQTAEGNYPWLSKNFLRIRVPSRQDQPYTFTVDLSTKRTYPTLEALVSTERDREENNG